MLYRLWQKKRVKVGLILLILFLFYLFSLPNPLFKDPTCMVLEDRHGDLLGARIAADGQWRFPQQDTIPEKFAKALIEFEDRRFYYHPGFDPTALARAFAQNLRNSRIVSGGSTITMQVIRLARKDKPRNLYQKLVEIILATRLELTRSKRAILALYASHAPFGGNVVGLDAASWRYFGKQPKLLSWAEAATLAVLPNSPALIHPGRNRAALLEKRNRLLDKLLEKKVIDTLTSQLAKEEPLPDEPHPLPRLAPHLLDRAFLEYVQTGKFERSRLRTTVDLSLQNQVANILQRHQQLLSYNEIRNIAAIVLDVETGEVLAYAGNVLGAGEAHNEQVDVIKAPRSTGSILKPLLFAMALQEGEILPNSLLSDVPTQLSGYRPENFHHKFDGVISARKALIRSLNVPFINLLQQYGLEKFHFQLQQLGFKTINKPASHYGLPLILGGAESTLWDITSAYAGMARTLNHFYKHKDQYNPNDFHPPTYLYSTNSDIKINWQPNAPRLSASAIWFTLNAMQALERPDAEGNWQQFESSRRIAWKTGTSVGFRDAWAVGVDGRYAVGIWAGNADGEGRPGLLGVMTAAPALFDIFNRLPQGAWFEAPYSEMTKVPVCKQSGYRATELCAADTVWIPKSGLNVQACPYHQLVHLDKSRRWQVSADCESVENIVNVPWFILPPVEEHYYKAKNSMYRPLLPMRPDCESASESRAVMQLIYPKQPTQIYVPVDLNGKLSRTVFTVAHRSAETVIYWHIDGEYLGSTQTFHTMELNPSEGKHKLTLVDEKGNRLEQGFEIIKK